ncbi:MAG: permease [Candidatus Aenigmarchaeota archaeon]|nr:permease [Candidatus Aenigmarchaeota archaeon]
MKNIILTGPSLSLPNMLVIRKVLGSKQTIVYICLVIAFSTIAGLVFDMKTAGIGISFPIHKV